MCSKPKNLMKLLLFLSSLDNPKEVPGYCVFKKKFAICLFLQRQQDKHIITSQGLDCVPGSNFTGMWCKTTTPPKHYIYIRNTK